jgi:signal transduction histidine kinase
LISSLLDLNKLERGQLNIDPELVDARAVLDEVRETCLPEAEKKHLKLEIDCSDQLPQLHADPVRLRQILINLVGNAVKFTPAHGRVKMSAVVAEMTLQDPEDGADGFGAALMMAPEPAIEFRISDSGIGIPADHMEKIFDAFYQVDGSSTREYGGAGLGLAIAKNLVEAHHGRIRVESKPNQGSTFFVTLPQLPADPA